MEIAKKKQQQLLHLLWRIAILEIWFTLFLTRNYCSKENMSLVTDGEITQTSQILSQEGITLSSSSSTVSIYSPSLLSCRYIWLRTQYVIWKSKNKTSQQKIVKQIPTVIYHESCSSRSGRR